MLPLSEMDGTVSAKKRLKALQLLSLLLPPLNRLLFKKLVELLHLVSQKTINLMTSKNLAVVFAPNIAAKTVRPYAFRKTSWSLLNFIVYFVALQSLSWFYIFAEIITLGPPWLPVF